MSTPSSSSQKRGHFLNENQEEMERDSPMTKKKKNCEDIKTEVVEESFGEEEHGSIELTTTGITEYEKKILKITPSTFREAFVKGFVIRSFDAKINASISASTIYNLFHESRTHSPIIVVPNFDDLSRIVVLDGTHRICQLLSRSEDVSTENFQFETLAYSANKDFGKIFESCVKVKANQTKRANALSFPPTMLSLVQNTYGREFAKSLAQFSKKQQSEALSIILNMHVKKEVKEDIQMALKRNNAWPLLALYRKCFSQGLVGSESTESHSEKSPFFQYFMGEITGKVFLEHMDAVYAASKCHLLILKASSIEDGETAKAVNLYLTKQIDGKKLMNELNRIIKGEDNFIKCEYDDTDEVRSATSKLSRLSTKITTRETIAISDPLMSPVKNEERSGAREVPEHLIELDRVPPSAFVPDETAVVCQKPTSESVFKVVEDVNQVPIGALLVVASRVPYVNELAEKGVSVVVIDPLETSSLFQDMIRLSETCKVVRIGEFSKRNFIATGSLIKPGVPGTRLSASTLSTLLIKLTEGEASRARKPKKEVYTISGFQPKI